jgi:hypothetical protein
LPVVRRKKGKKKEEKSEKRVSAKAEREDQIGFSQITICSENEDFAKAILIAYLPLAEARGNSIL